MITQLGIQVKTQMLSVLASTWRWAALLSEEPFDYTTRSELGGTAYTRQPIVWGPRTVPGNPASPSLAVYSAGVVVNLNRIEWSGLYTSQVVSAIGVCSSRTGGPVGFYALLGDPVRIGDSPLVDAATQSPVGRYGMNAYDLAVRLS